MVPGPLARRWIRPAVFPVLLACLGAWPVPVGAVPAAPEDATPPAVAQKPPEEPLPTVPPLPPPPPPPRPTPPPRTPLYDIPSDEEPTPALVDPFLLRPAINYSSLQFGLATRLLPPNQASLQLTKYILSLGARIRAADGDVGIEARADMAFTAGDDTDVFFHGAQGALRYRVLNEGPFQGILGMEVEVATASFQEFDADLVWSFPYFTVAWWLAPFQFQVLVGAEWFLWLEDPVVQFHRPGDPAGEGMATADLTIGFVGRDTWFGVYGLTAAWAITPSWFLSVEPLLRHRMTPENQDALFAYITVGPAYRSSSISAVIGVQFPLNHRDGQDDFVPIVSVAWVF